MPHPFAGAVADGQVTHGARIGSDVLSPVTCQPDRRVSSVRHVIAGALKPGENDGPSGSY